MTARILVEGAGTENQKSFVLVDGDGADFPQVKMTLQQAGEVAELVEMVIKVPFAINPISGKEAQ